ncbi:hypothetical protein MMC10_009574 [Thelotrema lepadinum]|nr:hypothetical protein [Thelotrema lepadinum]
MIAKPEGRAQVLAAEPRWKAKFILRIVILVFDFLAIVLAGAVPGIHFSLIPLSFSFAWCVANIIVRVRRPRPMHPGANVAMDLLIWMGFFVVLFLDWAWVARAVYIYRVYYELDYFDGFAYGYRLTSTHGQMQVATTIFSTFSLFLHLVLFVWACLDTSKRSKAEIEFRRIAIAEKIKEEASLNRGSNYEQEGDGQSGSREMNQDYGDARLSYSSIDIGTGSPRRSISPPDSPGPSSPAPAYLSGPNPSDSKSRFEQTSTRAL